MKKLAARWLRRGIALASIAVVVVATQLVAPAPAAANVRGIVLAFGGTALDMLVEKTAVAVCPQGKRLIGGGGRTLNAPDDRVFLTRLVPNHDSTDSFAVTGRADPGGTSSPWVTQAWALCSDPPPGLVIVNATAPQSPYTSTVAGCPDGKTLIGMGGEVTDGSGAVQLTTIAPVDAHGTEALDGVVPRGVTVAGESLSRSGQWQETAYAVCVADVYITKTARIAVQQPGERHSADIQCGQISTNPRLLHVTSVGFAHESVSSTTKIHAATAMPWAGSPPHSALITANWHSTQASNTWDMTAYAICTQ
jgi:hypothetical protein